ncbi:oligosaccharide flippase family protein [Paludicola sp. MB14-C6]|uniref:oligosaccharide flippase family protein n=1 Tax=Paludihabitans sp. MB14-C6 TaxID=3070656 RepID=UPI0027DBF0F6|nr:oligosaccharide flippase family protein [Paludicola sp. MB14-C6]WMJ23071.1 oligosaccharide flippase family protein [Paludicola sp. MB14-C6]
MQQRSLARNGIYKAILNIFNLLIPLIVTPYITGLLEPNLYGAYNRIFSEFNIFLTLGTFGIYNYGVREISKVRDNPIEKSKLFSSLFSIGIISNFIMTFIYVLFFTFRANKPIEVYLYLVMIIQIVGNIFYIEFVNEANEDYGFITKKTIIVRIIYLVSIFVFVRKPSDILPYSIIISSTILINNLASYFHIKKHISFNFQHLQIVRHLYPLIVTLLLSNVEILYTQLDKIMLSPFINDIAVTEYVLPTSLVGTIAAVPLALINVAIPRLSSFIGQGNKSEYTRVLNKTINNYMLMVIPMGFGMAALAQEIMQFFSKGVYANAFPVLIVSGMARVVFGYQSIIMNLIMYINSLEKQLTTLMLVFGIVNLGFNFGLVGLGLFSPFTALVTTVIAVLLFVIVGYIYTRKKLQLNYKLLSKEIIGYIVVSLTFFPISWVIRGLSLGLWPTIIIVMIICSGIYGLYLLVTKDTFVLDILNKVKLKLKRD